MKEKIVAAECPMLKIFAYKCGAMGEDYARLIKMADNGECQFSPRCREARSECKKNMPFRRLMTLECRGKLLNSKVGKKRAKEEAEEAMM